jgi:acetyl-CoA carboxylase biotin carboxyl carrier protein
LIIIEAMKMEIPVIAPESGRVVSLLVKEGDMIAEGDTVAELEA